MKILLTNDDGIQSPGLWRAARALGGVGKVFVVAPDREQSGTGAGLTLRSALAVRPVPVERGPEADGGPPRDITAYEVEGTPGDCCVLALEKLVGPVDLVVSGINAGSNLGWDVMVSGTVGGALQGFVRGYSSIAISVGSIRDPHFEVAAKLLRLIALQLRDRPPDSSLFLNINVPSVPLNKIAGLRVTKLGGRSYGESVRQEGTGGQKRYWISRDRPIAGRSRPGTDLWAAKNHFISVTPLQAGLGRQNQVPEVEGLLSGLPGQLLGQPD